MRLLRSIRPALLVLAALAAPHALAAEAVLLDLSLPNCWEIEQWSKAPGALSAGEETSAGVPLPEALCRPLRVRIDWPAPGEFRFFSVLPKGQETRVPYRLSSVRAWVKGGGDGHPVELGFKDADGQSRKVGLATLDFTEWREVRAEIPADWKQPLELTGITWHNWGMQTGGAAVTELAGLLGTVDTERNLLEAEVAPRLLAVADDPNGIAWSTEPCGVEVRALGWEPLPAGAMTLLRTLSRAGEAEGAQTVATPVDAGGASAWATTVALESDRNGCADLRLALHETAGERELAVRTLRLAWVTRPWPVNGGQRLASPIGVNTHVGAPWHAFGRLGIHWARDYSWTWLGHGETAPQGNGRDFAAVLAEAEANGVLVLPVLQGAFRNSEGTGYSSDSAMLTASFERLAKAFPTIPFWEPDNEYDLALASRWYPPGNYENALQAMAQGLADAGRAKLVLTGTAGIRYEETVDLLHSPAARSFAAANSHFYTGTAAPEEGVSDTNTGGTERYKPLSGIEQLARISTAAHRAGKFSWLTEIGWDVLYGPAVSEEEQCLYLPRAYLLARLAGADKVFWFYDRDIPGSTGRFASSGLLRADGSLRPSGVALAQLSRETAHAELQGTLDLGGDSYAAVFSLPDGGLTIAAWAPTGEVAVPASLGEWPATDAFGNATRHEALQPSVTYFHGWTLPEDLSRQLAARWTTGAVVTGAPGEAIAVAAEAPPGTLAWEGLPEGVSASAWGAADGARRCTLTLSPDLPLGVYRFHALAAGEGWAKRLRLTLSVEPALRTACAPYVPGQAELLTVSTTERPQQVTISGGEGAVVAPSAFAVEPGRPQQVALAPSGDAREPIVLGFRTEAGAVQELAVPCIRWSVPAYAAAVIDGVPDGWAEEAWMPEANLHRSDWAPRGVRVAVARAPEGLVVAISAPATEPRPGQTTGFWESTHFEVFADPTGSSGAWSRAGRQAWVVPLRGDGGAWSAAVGLWDRKDGAREAPGAVAGASLREGSLCVEVLLPWSLLGAQPQAGAEWRLAIAGQVLDGGTAWDLGWPARKSAGLLVGPGAWGLARFP